MLKEQEKYDKELFIPESQRKSKPTESMQWVVGLAESPFDSEDDFGWKDKSDWMSIRALVELHPMLVIINLFLSMELKKQS
jgi:hypothetical protein